MSKRLKLNTVLPTLGWDVTLKILYELALVYIDDIAKVECIEEGTLEFVTENLGLLCSVHSRVHTGRIKELYTKCKQLLCAYCISGRRLNISRMQFHFDITKYWDGYNTKQRIRGFIYVLCFYIKQFGQVYRENCSVAVVTKDYDVECMPKGYLVQVVTRYIK